MAVEERAAVDPVRGLTASEVAERVARGAVNDVPAAPTRSVAQIVRANVFTRFNAILGAMLGIIVVVGPFQDALFGLVLVANATIGIVQELRAKQTLDQLRVLTAPRACVVRDAHVEDIAVHEIVLDDVLEVTAGAQIAVDGEVLVGGMEVDESLLTGEADPVAKAPGDDLLSGSFVVAGSGRYRATKVGRDAYAARLAEEARRFTLTRSELRAGIDRILLYVTFAIIPTAALLFVSQIRTHDSWRLAVSGAVAGTVAMVPEGLVLLTSVAFAVAVRRLAARRVLVQELPAVEGLARIDVLCIDKTGTLTEGRLEVERVERLTGDDPAPALGALAAADAAPNATTRAIADAFTPPEGWTADRTIPFSSARKWSGASFPGRGSWVLGAPDVLLGPVDERRGPLDRVAALGKRVVLLGKVDDLAGDHAPTGTQPVAAVILADRIRPDAEATLRYFAQQGVEVKVLSGDNPTTVAAIAGSLGLPGAETPVDARDLPEDAEPELADALVTHSVFGRVAPRQKRAMVRALRARGHTVAMTGDGVNDALALKEADIGIAMGGGSEATRAVAQLVLLDSTFDALPAVVAEGRRVLGNIERTSGLYLTKTVYAMILALATGAMSFVFPFLPRHLTLIGAFTIGIPSFFLALAPNAERFRPGFVGRVLRFAIPTGVLVAIATLFSYRLAANEPGITLDQARTAAVLTLTWMGFAVLMIVAAPLTAWRLMLVWAMAGLFVLTVALPMSREFFALSLPPLIVWLAGIGIAAITWSLTRLFVPEERPVGRRWRDVAT